MGRLRRNMNIRKKAILTISAIIIVGICIISFNKISKDRYPQEFNKIMDLLKGFGTTDFDIEGFLEHQAEDENTSSSEYHLSKDAWVFNFDRYIKDEKYKDIMDDISKNSVEALSTKDEFIPKKHFKDDGKDIFVLEYRGVNQFRYEFILNELRAYVTQDVWKNEKSNDYGDIIGDEMKLTCASYIQASNLINPFIGELKESESREITITIDDIERDDFRIENMATVMSQLKGMNSAYLLKDDEAVYGDYYIQKEKKYAKEIYDTSIAKKRYDPQKPLDIKTSH